MSLIIDPYRFGSFDPTTAIAWEAAFWASDPSWSNPGNGNPVSAWRNFGSRAGAGDAAQSTANRKPTYLSSVAGLNNQPGVSFDGAGSGLGDYLITGNFSSAFTTQGSIIVIGKRDGAGAGGNESLATCAGSSAFTTLYFASGKVNLYASSGFAGPAFDNSAHLYRGRTNGASSAIAVDESVTTGTVGATSYAFVSIGRGGNDTDQPKMTVAFVGLYSGDITTDGQWSAFKTWAASTYGLTIS